MRDKRATSRPRKEVQMRYRLAFSAGFAAGFVAGARAGRERYEQIKQVARRMVDSPTVQQAAGALQAQAGELAQTAKQKVGGKLHDKMNGRHGSAVEGDAYIASGGTQDGPPARH